MNTLMRNKLQADIARILSNRFSEANFLKLIGLIFDKDVPNEQIFNRVDQTSSDINEFKLAIYHPIELDDRNELVVGILYHTRTIESKVSLVREVFKVLKNIGYSKALIAFVPKNSQNWRLSYIQLTPQITQKGARWNLENPRRYSFVVGTEIKGLHTPIKRLTNFATQSPKTASKLLETFSVEPLTKEFYKELIKWVNWAIAELKIGDNSDELKRHFIITFITRIIFIWFLKQKKLVPEKLFEERVLQNILTTNNLSESPKTTYYKGVLHNLFFKVLNTPINKRNTKQFDFTEFIKDASLLEKLCSYIPFLNGGLFEATKIDDYVFEKDFNFPDYLFFTNEHKKEDQTYEGLFSILKRYHFTVTENTPLDKEVALDPELLGHIFENLLAEQLDETKQSARKATGSYYTPQDIVDFMVEESLKEYFKTKVTYEDKNEFQRYLDILFSPITNHEDIARYKNYNEQVLKAISAVKIIDPAVGSGAFPMGILNKIVFLLQKLDPDNKRWKEEQLAKIEALDLPPAQREEQKKIMLKTFKERGADYLRKLYIIRDSIYGVDIQPIAIQIARLRFFLSLIIEETPKLNNPEENFGIEPLPNLYMNLIIANSLIPLDYTLSKENPLKQNRNQLLLDVNKNIENAKQKWIKIIRDLFWESDPQRREQLKQQEIEARKAFAEKLKGHFDKDYERIINWNPYNPHQSADWFDPLFMLGVEDGFDIVIANPPYVRQERIRDQKPKLQKAAYKLYSSTADLYVYFFEKAYNLLKDQGICTFITSNKWFRAKYGQKLREFLADNTKILKIIDFRGYQVFAATVDTQIIIFKKEKLQKDHKVQILNIASDFNKDTQLKKYFAQKHFLLPQKYLSPQIYLLVKEPIFEIKKKIEELGTPLKEWDVNINYGIKTGYNKAFIIDEETRQKILDNCKTEEERKRTEKIIKPVLRGRDIKRYYYKWAHLYMILTSKDTNINDYQTLKEYLTLFKDKLTARSGQQKWYQLQGKPSREKIRMLQKFKIGYPDITTGDKYSIIPSNYIGDNTVYFIIHDNLSTLKYLLAFLNAEVLKNVFHLYANSLGNKSKRSFTQYIKILPIPEIPKEKQKPFVELVDEILKITSQEDYERRKDLQKKVEELSREIDELVYGVYKLSSEEVQIVKNGNK